MGNTNISFDDYSKSKDFKTLKENREKLVQSWADVIDRGTVVPGHLKEHTAITLNNTRKWISENYNLAKGTSADSGVGSFGNLHTLVIPLVKRLFGKSLILKNLVDTQSMLGPTGIAFGLRFFRGEIGQEGSLNLENEYGRPRSNRVSGSGLKAIFTVSGITDLNLAAAVSGATPLAITGANVGIADGSAQDFVLTTATDANVVKVGPNGFKNGQITVFDTVANVEKTVYLDWTAFDDNTGGDYTTVGDTIIAAMAEGEEKASYVASLAAANNDSKIYLVRELLRNTVSYDVSYSQILGKWKDSTQAYQDQGNDLYSSQYGNGADAEYAKVRIGVQAKATQARTRALYTDWPYELEHDMKQVQNVSLEDLLIETIESIILDDLERELLGRMKKLAIDKDQAGADIKTFTVTSGVADAQGRWIQEKLSSLLTFLTIMAEDIKRSTRLGRGNFAIVTPTVATSLLSVSSFFSGIDINKEDSDDAAFVGSVNKIKIFEDMWSELYDGSGFDGDFSEVLMGFKGTRDGESGLVYLPYQPVTLYKAIDPKSMQPAISIKMRYAIMDNLIDSGAFYRGAVVKGINSTIAGA